jgi:PadR family transcriptional regulator, regulatory protein PadR
MKGEELKGHLDLLLLSALAEGPSHGYLLIERLRARSDGTFDLPEGTVYPALHRLERDGLLSSAWTEATGRRRRVYRLTRRGRASLARRASEWRSFSRAVEAVIA